MKKTEAQTGDFVEVSLIKNSYRGTLLETPEDEHGIVLLKLESGYNMGFNKKDIFEIIVLRKAKEEKKVETKVKHNSEKPNIGMIITGGTIASKLDTKTGAVSPLTNPEELFRYYPEIFDKVNITKIDVPFMKSSEDMDYRDWQKIARTAARLLNDSNIQGIIITHGTDTLHYTSAALSFFLKNLNKPVVLTYSQRSVDRASSDANLNLQCAAFAATTNIAEVMLVGHATENDDYCFAMPGAKVRKMHSSRRDAFKTINAKPFAKIWPEKIEIISSHKIRDNRKKVTVDSGFEEKVALVKIHPGQEPGILDYYLKKKYKGIILEATGLGHVPTKARKSWTSTIKNLVKRGVFVGITTQCIYGRVDPYVYSNLRTLNETGAVFLEDMLSETALVKLGWLLGHKEWRNQIKEKMLENVTGEFNDRLEE